MVVLWRSPVQQLLWPRDIGRSLGKLCVTKRWEKRRVGVLSVCRKSRECSAVAGEADGEAGRADGGGEREQSEFQLWNCSLTQHIIGCSGFFLFSFVLNKWKIQLLHSPRKESIPYAVRMQCAKCWSCVQLVGNHVWPSHALLGSELEKRTAVMRAVLGCTKQKGRFQCCLQDVQEAKSRSGSPKGGRKEADQAFLHTSLYIFSHSVLCTLQKYFSFSFRNQWCFKDTLKGLTVIVFLYLNSSFSWMKVGVMCFGGNIWTSSLGQTNGQPWV